MQKNDVIEIDIQEILFLLLRKWYIVAVCFLLATGSSFAVTQFYLKPVYKAQTTLFLGKEDGKVGNLSIGDLQLSNQLIVDYREILKSDLVAEKISKKLGVNAGKFKGNVAVNTVKDSRIFSISYEDNDPKLAADVVNELANEIQQMASQIIEVKNVKVIDSAKIPPNPIKPNKKKNIGLAGFFGLILGASLVYLLELVDHTFKKPEEVEKQLGLNVIGTIPRFDGGKRNKSNKKKDLKEIEQTYYKNLISRIDPKAPATEAFREIGTNLHYISVDRELKTIIITSPSSGDGKTVTAVNLAVTLARTGKKVLLIDADLRKPKVHAYFGIRNGEGLTNLLIDDKEHKVGSVEKCDNSNLYILTSGPIPPNPYEMLSSNRMQKLIEYYRTIYDVLIIDTPPVGQVTDAAVLAGIADGAIIVMASGETRIDMAKRAQKALEGVNTNIIGIVLTKMDMSRTSYYNYNYTYKYD